jgi:hypothetical protein
MPESPIRKKIKRHIAQALYEIGVRIVTKAEQKANKTEIQYLTGNLADAYGCVVFYGDQIAYKSDGSKAIYFPLNPPSASSEHRWYFGLGHPDGYGRDWANKFLDSFKPSDSFTESSAGIEKVFTLVVFNAAYYAYFLETGAYAHTWGKEGKHFKIISNFGTILEHEVRAFAKKSNVKMSVSHAVPLGDKFKTVHKKK